MLLSYFGLNKFNQYIFVRLFKLSTDNKSLNHIFDRKADLSSVTVSRIAKWALLLLLNTYDYDIEFRPNKAHANADMLSRLPVSDTEMVGINGLYNHQVNSLPISAVKVRRGTTEDNTLREVLYFLEHDNWPEKEKLDPDFFHKRNELSLENGIIMWNLRVVIPKCLESKILNEITCSAPGNCQNEILKSYSCMVSGY